MNRVPSDITRPRLVVSDVDGTLIDWNERVSPRTRAAVAAVVAAGVPFILATGRPPRWVIPVVEQLGYAPPITICGNGAVLYDSAADRVLSTHSLEVGVLRTIADLAYKFLPGCGLAAERVGSSAHDTASVHFASTPDYEHAWLNPTHNPVPLDEVLDTPATKLLIRVAGSTSQSMRDAMLPHVAGLAEITFSTNNGLIELAVPGVSKGAALARVAAGLGIAPEDIVAFGDMPNDVSMLTLAGHAVAMGNAHASVGAVASEVTASNGEDGVAQVLERWWQP